MVSHAIRSVLYLVRPSGVFAYVSSVAWARLASSTGSGLGVRQVEGVMGVWGTFLVLNKELGWSVFSLVGNGLGVVGLKRVWGVCGGKRLVYGIWGGMSRPRVVGVAGIGELMVGMFVAIQLKYAGGSWWYEILAWVWNLDARAAVGDCGAWVHMMDSCWSRMRLAGSDVMDWRNVSHVAGAGRFSSARQTARGNCICTCGIK